MKASGIFEVLLSPLDTTLAGEEGFTFSRLSIEKKFSGELSGSGLGEMISAVAPVHGPAGYVAMEVVRGRLAGRQGSFVLQHYGTMTPDKAFLLLEVAPASGTGELEGITGKMAISIFEGQHYYEFEYELPH